MAFKDLRGLRKMRSRAQIWSADLRLLRRVRDRFLWKTALKGKVVQGTCQVSKQRDR